MRIGTLVKYQRWTEGITKDIRKIRRSDQNEKVARADREMTKHMGRKVTMKPQNSTRKVIKKVGRKTRRGEGTVSVAVGTNVAVVSRYVAEIARRNERTSEGGLRILSENVRTLRKMIKIKAIAASVLHQIENVCLVGGAEVR
jgi:hypothetical protein